MNEGPYRSLATAEGRAVLDIKLVSKETMKQPVFRDKYSFKTS